ncbi:MAG TPA: signal peptidase II [Lachnospiraceae bacterium]|nr:signal peptidase II [Lachnospiraceae bacterium]
MKNIRKKIYPVIAALLLIFIDQSVKGLAASRLKGHADFPLLPDILEFSYLENTGAAFSSFMGKQEFLITLTSLAMLFLILKYLQIPKTGTKRYLPMKAVLVLIISGGIGNLIDRILNGYVVDFIYFVPINFPKFNIADCYVCIGMALLVYLCFFYYKDEELDFLFTLQFPTRKKS